MEGHASTMGPSGDFSVPADRSEQSISISTETSSSRRAHCDGAEGTARAQRKRKLRTACSDEKTQQLLTAYRKRMDENGRSFMRREDWQSISESVDGMAGKDCQRRMDTLTKSFSKIRKYCAEHNKQFGELGEEDFRSMKLATKMEDIWYYQMCEIKEKPGNAMVVPISDSRDQGNLSSSAPGAVMAQAGPYEVVAGQVVGTQELAWRVQNPPRSTSPTDLQSHNGASPGLARHDDPPYHPHPHANPVQARIGTFVNTSAPSHIPPVDLESSHIFGGLEVLVELPTALNIFHGPVNFEYPRRSAGCDFWTLLDSFDAQQ